MDFSTKYFGYFTILKRLYAIHNKGYFIVQQNYWAILKNNYDWCIFMKQRLYNMLYTNITIDHIQKGNHFT